MKKQLLVYLTNIVLLLFVSIIVKSQNGIPFPQNKKLPRVTIYSSGKIENFKIEASRRSKAGGLPTSTFDVTYDGFSEEAKTAFAEAVKLWSYLIKSQVPIKINAKWEPLGENILGSAGAASYRRGFVNAPLDSAWYPIAIANKLAGYDIEPEVDDISASFSSTFNWYLGTDGNCPDYQYDLISVVMHEIGHGLGFVGSATTDLTTGSWGVGTNIPFIYDVFVYNGLGQQLIDTKSFKNPSSNLKKEYTSENIFFKSELGDAASPSGVVPLYAPKTWDSGSSYSHLGEYFNGGPNTMMTYSVGYGEVTHDPGPVTLALFAEMGWGDPVFKHQKVKDQETINAPILVETEIYSDIGLNENSIKLHYSANNFLTDNQIVLTTNDGVLYSGSIPVLSADSVKYYFEATTSINRKYYYPAQGVLPVDSIKKTLGFAIRTDTTPPIIVHENPKGIFNTRNQLDIVFGANDNLGIANTYIQYKVNNSELSNLDCQVVSYSKGDDLYSYRTSISIENLYENDTIFYRIVAYDSAKVSNTTILPDGGYFKVAVLEFGTLVEKKAITFDDAGDKNLFYEEGLTVMQPNGFNSKGLHSPHPYLEGDPFPDDQINYSAILKTPVIVKDKSVFLRFKEVVLVEPGDPGSVFGDANFWDYVIVEGSVDTAQTWFYLQDGYDSNISTSFKNTYSAGTSGAERMYRTHSINLLNNNKVEINDTMLIRFRLYSDPLTVGWGWAIDNLEIQPYFVSVKNSENPMSLLSIYPNPSNGSFEINIAAKEPIDNYNVVVYNSLGVKVYSEIKKASSINIIHPMNLSKLPEGVYFVSFNYNNRILSQKIVIE